MKVIDFEMDHLRRIKVREMERSDLGDNFIEDHGELYLSSQYRKTVLNDEGEIIMCMGGKIEKRAAHVWIIASDLIFNNPVASLETIINLEKEATEMHQVKFLYTFNSPEFPFAIRFLERIGYKRKGVLNNFKDGKERVILAKEIF